METFKDVNYESDCFKKIFKSLKRKNPPPDYSGVIDFYDIVSTRNNKNVRKSNCKPPGSVADCKKCGDLGLAPHSTWNVFEIDSVPGLLFISNPFTESGLKIWITNCLEKYPEFPNLTNLHRDLKHPPEPKYQNLWQSYAKDPKESELRNLCWATLGYHHNWDTKIYDANSKTKFPPCLKELCCHTADSLNFKNYNPEAAIVNYYHLASILNGHTDHSEIDCEAPIFSYSFGRTAIFMIGGLTKSTIPISVVASAEDVETLSEFKTFLEKSRININVRQVYPLD